MDQNPKEGFYSWNVEALHRTFVKHWEIGILAMGKNQKLHTIIILVDKNYHMTSNVNHT